jgi:hypothetical protein
VPSTGTCSVMKLRFFSTIHGHPPRSACLKPETHLSNLLQPVEQRLRHWRTRQPGATLSIPQQRMLCLSAKTHGLRI